MGQKSTCFSLIILPKKDPKHGASALQVMHNESLNCLVVGNRSQMFLLPCKETAQFCDHTKFTQKSFTFHPDKPDEQFNNYLKLTFCNELKREDIVEKSFHFLTLKYTGDGVHALMETHNKYKFIA